MCKKHKVKQNNWACMQLLILIIIYIVKYIIINMLIAVLCSLTTDNKWL